LLRRWKKDTIIILRKSGDGIKKKSTLTLEKRSNILVEQGIRVRDSTDVIVSFEHGDWMVKRREEAEKEKRHPDVNRTAFKRKRELFRKINN